MVLPVGGAEPPRTTHPGGSVDGGALLDQHVSDPNMTFLCNQVQGSQPTLGGGKPGQRSEPTWVSQDKGQSPPGGS